MEQIPLLNLLPEKYRGTALLLIALAPYLTRAYHAISSGGGLVGVWRAVMFGTNVDPKIKQIADAVENGQTVTITRDTL